MRRTFFLFFSITIFLYNSVSFGVDKLPDNLTSYSSTAGKILFTKNVNSNAIKLLANFTTQQTSANCAIASSVMILNSMDLLPPLDPSHPPYEYFTQDNFFNQKVLAIIIPEEMVKKGVSLTKLAQALESYGLMVRAIPANEMNLQSFRETLRTALNKEEFIIVNFLRTGLLQKGGGHHSPIAAYDESTDQFLILDVARYKYPAFWVKAEDLWTGVNTYSTSDQSYRGLVIVTP